MKTTELAAEIGGFLEADNFQDYAPNGLQVEGGGESRRILLGVTASQALLDRALERGADTVLVHHGWFWKGESPRVIGMKARRLRTLMKHDIALLAYHLPLDAHPEVGNNAEIARKLELSVLGKAGSLGLLHYGEPLGGEVPFDAFFEKVGRVFERTPQLLGRAPERVRRVAWCSGAAQDEIECVAALGCDVYISGEASERTTHEARELGIAYLACGHHATERFGIQALGRWLASRYPELEIAYEEVDNPI